MTRKQKIMAAVIAIAACISLGGIIAYKFAKPKEKETNASISYESRDYEEQTQKETKAYTNRADNSTENILQGDIQADVNDTTEGIQLGDTTADTRLVDNTAAEFHIDTETSEKIPDTNGDRASEAPTPAGDTDKLNQNNNNVSGNDTKKQSQ